LYFTASTDVGPTLASSMGAFKVPDTRSGYLIVLNKDLKSPLAPQSDEEKSEAGKSAAASDKLNPALEMQDCSPKTQAKGSDAAKETPKDTGKAGDKGATAKKSESDSKEVPPVRVDFENIDQRILALPFPTRNYGGMLAGKTHVLFLL